MEGSDELSEDLRFLFHIGGTELEGIEELDEKFEYRHLKVTDHLNQELMEIQPLAIDQINNSNSIYLLSDEVMSQLNKIDLSKLPSHQLFCESLNKASEEELRILKLKGTQIIDLSDHGITLIQYINKNYTKPWGTSLDNSMVEISPYFEGTVTKKGVAMYVLDGDFGADFKQVMLWKNKWGAAGHVNFYPEMNASDQISYFWRAYFKNGKEGENLDYMDFFPEQFRDKQVSFDLGHSEFPVNFGLFVRGYGQVEIGDLHIRYGLDKNNFLAMGGRRLTQTDHMKEEIGYYFNAGDLKPPLNVYFSGFRPSEGFEGRWMMGSLGAPFLLIYDPRLVGGAFYRGEGLEEQIVSVIKQKLQLLNFSKHELVLSGLSMGTYASFYYGARLEPHAIIVGKPLANIGGLAVNSRIFSPYDWDLAMDTIIHLTGELTHDSAKTLDDDFWRNFEAADFSDTTFIIAHMLHDTDRPFKRIFNYLKKTYPTAKILHKGLEGRHNDNTPGVTSWFYNQYQQFLISDYNRKLKVDEEIEEVDLRGENDD
ncbi:accessory Sec system protein Asp2 [Lactococcus hircilactis]|uniref:Accessory Sec system protein Asp2 n=1 Tax=Lactococcus hircilactis TaxID=1494462 RepID=A0A7X2D070_9LACT|nr:accessory Sec system protein Asp2 [Lactococcus hircilactis]